MIIYLKRQIISLEISFQPDKQIVRPLTRWVRFIFLHRPLLNRQGWKEAV